MYNKDYKILAKYRSVLTNQEIRTLRGQIKAGDTKSALIGLERLLKGREERAKAKEANRSKTV